MEKVEDVKPDVSNETTATKGDFVARIRGLPWSASKDDIMKFFSECTIKNSGHGIHLTMSKEGRPSGEAYVEFDIEADYNKALSKDNEHLGNRYIEVFQATRDEMDWALRRCGLDGNEAFGDACVRLRGLPYGCSKEEIAQFFTGLEIVRNGITLATDFMGRSTGEAYVQFASQEIAEKAMGKHKEKIGHRYIEIFKSSLQEIRSAMGVGPMRMRNMGNNRSSPYDRMDRPGAYGGFGMNRGPRAMSGKPGRRGGPMEDFPEERFGFYERNREDLGSGHRVHMRGLPYRAHERDIYEFFAPLNPVSVNFKFESSGRSSGEADVEFHSHEEAVKAMKRDKEKIQHRYIELFLHSSPESFRRGNEGFDNMGGYPSEDRPYSMERPFSGRSRSFSGDRERSFMGEQRSNFGPGGGDRSFNSGERGFGSRGYGGGSDRGFSYAGSERSYGSGGGQAERSYGGQSDMGMSERSYSDYRNGMSSSSGGGGGGNMGGGGGYRRESNYGAGHSYGSHESKDDSEFYGSGKLFGENNFHSSMSQGMMGGSNYTSF